MKTSLIFIGCTIIAGLTRTAVAQEKKPEVRSFQFGIVYPLGTNGVEASQIVNVFSINCFMGMSAGVEAAEFSGFMSITDGKVNGIQGSGFLNINRGDIHGVHGAGFCNTSENVDGFQGAGFVNIAKNIDGVQGAGFCNIAKDVDGLQGAGFINISDNCDGAQLSGFAGVADNVKNAQLSGFANAADTVDGLQASGFINLADKTKGGQFAGFININGDVDGAQAAGFMNIGNDVKGAQISGFINVANDINGGQLGGFLNVANKVNGPQISGFLNVADSSEYPIGVINWVNNGTKQIVVETDENTAVNVLFKSGGRRTYGIFGFSYLPNLFEAYGVTAGIGVHFPLSTAINIDADYASSFYYDYSFKKDNYNFFVNNQLRLLLNYKINDFISVYAGPKLSLSETEETNISNLKGLELWNGSMGSRHRHHNNFDYGRLILGANVGIEISL